MGSTANIVLFDCGGKLTATVYGSKASAFQLTRIDDQLGQIAVKVTCTTEFDANRDYLVRQVNKNGSISTELVFGTMPKWAGGTLNATRVMLDSGEKTTRLLEKFPPRNVADKETLRRNGIDSQPKISDSKISDSKITGRKITRREDDQLNDNCSGN